MLDVEPLMSVEADEKVSAAARLRLIDHFKRVYTIVVGLAITEGVKNLFPLSPQDLPMPAIWMFGTFFVTIVPIFHGGDRSLDFKYMTTSQEKFSAKVAYIWDVYMLLITAILFVCIAKSVPQRSVAANDIGAYLNAGLFYFFMTFMLIMDIIILFIDRLKSRQKLNSPLYVLWMAFNAMLAAACWYVTDLIGLSLAPHAETVFVFLGTPFNLNAISVMIFLLAFARTIVDYVCDDISRTKFLFP